MGIVTRVCEEPFKEALALAADIAQKSPDAVAAAKRLYNKTYALRDREVRARRHDSVRRAQSRSRSLILDRAAEASVRNPAYVARPLLGTQVSLRRHTGLKLDEQT